MFRLRFHPDIVPVGRKGQDVRRLVVGHVDAEAGVHEQVAVLFFQKIGFRLELAAKSATLENRYFVGYFYNLTRSISDTLCLFISHPQQTCTKMVIKKIK